MTTAKQIVNYINNLSTEGYSPYVSNVSELAFKLRNTQAYEIEYFLDVLRCEYINYNRSLQHEEASQIAVLGKQLKELL